MNKTPNTHYDAFSRGLHWLTAIAVTAAFVLAPEGFGRLMRQGTDPATLIGLVWHESLGLLVLGLSLLRLLWLAVRPTAPRTPMAKWMHASSQLVHLALWGLMLALPLTALLALSSEGHALTLLGGLRLNQIPWISNLGVAQLADWGEVHELLGEAIMWLAGVHAGAAIFHHWVLKDGVLRTMLLRPDRSGPGS